MNKLTKATPEQLKQLDNAWFGVDIPDSELFDPLTYVYSGNPDEFMARFVFLMATPEYFYFICKHILNVDLLPIQCLVLHELWERKFPMLIGSRGFSKSFLLALYCILRMLLMPGRKLVIIGAVFRQSKVVFEYMETIWRNAPILRDLCSGSDNGPSREPDRYIMRLNGGQTLCLPLGNGQNIRGARANDIIGEEFASIPVDIFENVVAGFATVSASPVQKVKSAARNRMAIKLGIELEEESKTYDKSNQIILCGTAYYEWNHFAKYHKKYKDIIDTEGDRDKLFDLFNGEYPSDDFNWKDYSIIRIPVELIPEGLMDAGQIDRAKFTVHSGIFAMEYGATFSRDSTGFFKRSLIESCVLSNSNQIVLPSGKVHFEAKISGSAKEKYVIAVDPASEIDNFSIVIIEVHPDHKRIVYCWTTTKQKHRELLKAKISTDDDFYGYCARKIRSLMALFPPVEIAIDGQGGGVAVIEALRDRTKLKEGEYAIYPKIDEDNPKDSDDEVGLHILEVCQFARYEWLSEANHTLKKDFEDKLLIFPFFDPASVGMSVQQDEDSGRLYDNLEDCVCEIEELKNELAMIVMSESANGRGKWDTPDGKSGKKGKLRKDRYSALLMANMSARFVASNKPIVYTPVYGGFARVGKSEFDGPLTTGPAWWENGAYK